MLFGNLSLVAPLHPVLVLGAGEVMVLDTRLRRRIADIEFLFARSLGQQPHRDWPPLDVFPPSENRPQVFL